ncbi:MAG: hypothetical protein CEE40_07510 [Chloroflexi bacterium B3_Chlor]|nr:MAG: hypothetical protein CEE40_07510 [Chloroflexi bacterium B3_Chlor]
MERRVHSKVGIAIIIVGSIFLLTAGAALAASAAKSEPARLPAPTGGRNVATFVSSDTISSTHPITGGVMIPTCIGLFFDVPVTDVVTMRSDGLGWGEVAKVYFFANDAVTDVNYILELRTGGLGWGQIAKELDLSPGRHGSNLGAIISGRGVPTDTVPKAAQRLADRLEADPEAIANMLEEGATNGTVIVAHKLAAQFPGDPDATPDNLVERRLKGESWGQIRRDLKEPAGTTASGLSTSAGGKAHGHGKDGNQGHGKPEDKGNQGRGRGHDKDHGGGKKH